MKKIIVADDEMRIRKLVGDFLRSEGYEPVKPKTVSRHLIFLKQIKTISLCSFSI